MNKQIYSYPGKHILLFILVFKFQYRKNRAVALNKWTGLLVQIFSTLALLNKIIFKLITSFL